MKNTIFLLLLLTACSQSITSRLLPYNTISPFEKCRTMQENSNFSNVKYMIDDVNVERIFLQKGQIMGITCACIHGTSNATFDTLAMTNHSTITIFDYRDSTLKVSFLTNEDCKTFFYKD